MKLKLQEKTIDPIPNQPPTSRFQKIKLFLFRIRAGLVISLLGGVPGLINIWNWSHQTPKFYFHYEKMANGVFTNGAGVKFKYYLLAGAIYNEGSIPLFPYLFDLEAKYYDTTITSQSLGIDSSVIKVKYPRDNFVLKNDLSSVVKVSPLDASFGTLIFPIKYTNYDLGNLNNLQSLKITCTDILHRKWDIYLDVGAMIRAGNNDTFYDPKTGVRNF